MDKETALLFCKELAKKLPNINDTPPIKRLPRENYMQFYMFGVSHAIRETQQTIKLLKTNRDE